LAELVIISYMYLYPVWNRWNFFFRYRGICIV